MKVMRAGRSEGRYCAAKTPAETGSLRVATGVNSGDCLSLLAHRSFIQSNSYTFTLGDASKHPNTDQTAQEQSKCGRDRSFQHASTNRARYSRCHIHDVGGKEDGGGHAVEHNFAGGEA